MWHRALIGCIFSIQGALFGIEAEPVLPTQDEIRVHLSTANPLQPLYLSRLLGLPSSFSAGYLQQLEEIFSFDLKYNGTTALLPSSLEKEQVLCATDLHQALHPIVWKNFGIPYVIRWHIKDKMLNASILNTQTAQIKTFSDISLSGDLSQDRKQLHKLADGIHKALFHTDGIARSSILFAYQAQNPAEWVSEIWECDWDGANARQITFDNTYSITPVALPNHSKYSNDRFLYVSYKTGQPKIYLGNTKGGQSKRVIELRGNQLLPAISPQRDKIAFISDAGGRTDLFLQPLHPETGEVGKPQQLYSHPRSTQASPTFSPDGSKIAFVSDKDGGARIYVIPAVASEKRHPAVMLTKKNRENSCPCWSPDGTKLAYSAKTNGTRQIWVYDFVSGEEWQLTSGPGHKENPIWAPNSKHIVFNSTDTCGSELYLVNLMQAEVVKISHGPGKKHYPSWISH